MNKQRLEWHRERQASNTSYFRKLNGQKMADWREVWGGIDRNDPAVLDFHADQVSERAVRLLKAANVLDDRHRREGALQRAGRFVREARALEIRAKLLRAGEKPLDEWAECRCGSAFQPGPRAYTMCYGCSSKDWFNTSLTCVFCDRRHSMSFPLCFACKQDRSEDDARFLRVMVNQRDSYTCQMCGEDSAVTGVALQVDRINPDGGSFPWNLQTLCSPCSALKGKSYDKHDEREYWKLIAAYWGPLYDYLSSEEVSRLSAIEPDTDHEQIDFGQPVPWPDLGECSERDGLLTVIDMLGAVVM